jgi:predicted DNA-binding transcriptional regulator AlpA
MKCESVSPFFTPQTGLEIPQTVRLTQKLKGMTGWVKTAIATWVAQKSEPKVSEKRNRNGHPYYQVYDPVSNASATFSSEAEIRAWLEQRYYR